MPVEKRCHVAPLLSGDETKYRRRYRVLKDMVNDLSDESNLLALRVHKIQRRIYDHYLSAYGHAPPIVPLPADASWSPLVGNKEEYPPEIGAPLAKRAPKRHVGDAEEPLRRDRDRRDHSGHPASDMPDGSERGHDDRDGGDGRDDDELSVAHSMATSRAGTSIAGDRLDRLERMERMAGPPHGAKQEFQPPPDEWTLDRERAERKRGVKRERERSEEDDYHMEQDMREREARHAAASPRSDVDDY